MAATHLRARRERQLIAEHYRPLGDRLVRRLHGSAAGAINWLAAGAASIPNPDDDRVRPGADSLHRDGAIQAASGHLAENGRCTTLAHHEQ